MSESFAAIRILHLEDSVRDSRMIQDLLEVKGRTHKFTRATDRKQFETALEEPGFDLIICDFNLPDFDGLGALKMAKEKHAEIPVIIVSGAMDAEEAVECLRAGATDYLLKQRLERLPSAVARALEEGRGRHERKRAEEILRASQARMAEQATMLSSVRDAVFARDLDQRIFYWNSGAERLYGWPAREAFGRRANELLCADPDASASMEEILRTGEWRGELVHRNKDGREIIVESFRSLLADESGNPTGVLSINTDITARRLAMSALQHSTRELQQAKAALEEERTQLARRVAERTADLSAVNAELARANRLKSEFMANMSHELRTPLNAILGLSESLLEQRSATLTERQARAVRTIESSGAHLLGLINDVLDVSKVEAGKVELQIEAVDARATCEASLQLVRQQAIGKRLEIEFTCEMDDCPLHADARRLKQILVNLLSNAVKFTPEGGKIGLDVFGDAAVNRISFAVWDSGIGIAPEDQKRLFQPFVQLQTDLSRGYEGTGLGLVLVQRLTEIHGGSVTLESAPGRGSRFTVHLPWNQAPLACPHPSRSRSPMPACVAPFSDPSAPGGPCILLVEDNETSIQTMGDYLQDHGLRVMVARNGKEAIEQVRAAEPALVLMDIQMPVMDGLETIRHIRTNPVLARMPIIALTALAMPGDRERCLATGADAYLSKPVNLRELTRQIRRHLHLPDPA